MEQLQAFWSGLPDLSGIVIHFGVTLAILVIGWAVSNLLGRWMRHIADRSARIDPTIVPMIRSVTVWAVRIVVLLAVLGYTLVRKDMGHHHTPRFQGRAELLAACTVGVGIGFYDGFFGPGTGSFLLFGFVRFFGFDFLHASAATKLVNVATNFAAILMLASLGQIYWPLGLAMMVANITGSQFGSWLAIKHGSGFVRKAFLVIVSALILKSAWNAYFIN